ncbi:MAG TPA: hypothetical protein VMM92_05780 [Thermoanaerobaculia bacterium]|nr:hypothetical protein [Thermoanaerobaculia bacterium]
MRKNPSRRLSQKRQSWPALVFAVATFACGLALLASPAAAGGDMPGCEKGTVPNPAVNCPDRFAWQTLVKVSQPLPNHQALFEIWPNDCDTFPPKPDPAKCNGPNPNPENCPVLPSAVRGAAALGAAAPRVKAFQPRALQTPANLRRQAAGVALLATSAAPCDSSQALEIVHRNPSAFNFIKDHGLWYTDGLTAAFNSTADIQFPIDAIAVKTNWRPLCKGDDPSHYQLYKAPNGQLYGLIAMHISTKDLPNWFWATFEQEDNLGRCDYLGCHDSFGVTPGQVEPRSELGKPYAPGTLNPELVAMLKPLGAQWTHYRLKGSQVDFVTQEGQHTFLGNSVTEDGFVAGSSCMTCHSRGTVNQSGVNPYPTVAGLDPDFQSHNGPPHTDWFFFGATARRYALPMDFLWGMAFRAAPGCSQGNNNTCPSSCNLQ